MDAVIELLENRAKELRAAYPKAGYDRGDIWREMREIETAVKVLRLVQVFDERWGR